MSMRFDLDVTTKYAQPDSVSARLFEQATRVMPGGNTRTTVYMAPHPPYAAEGQGCWIVDVDGDRRLDCLNNYTALMHGHAHPAIVDAASRRLARGASFPMPTPEEVQLAALIVDRVPAIDQVRFTNPGSEAVMMALKAARAFTGRPRIAKFEGAYHGSYDYAEVSLGPSPEIWGSLAEPASVPYSKGITAAVVQDVIVLPFNHPDLAVRRIERHAHELAAVILDPVPNRAGLIPASLDFLTAVRKVTAPHGVLLIFDEVISFRVGYQGAQGLFGIRPDVTALGKIIGGGLPVGAVGGRTDVMAVFDSRGGKPAVPHGGTFNAKPVTMAAGLAAMRLMDPEAFRRLDDMGDKIRAGMTACFRDVGIQGSVSGIGSLFRVHATGRPMVDNRSTWPEPDEADRLARIVRYLLDHGVLISPTGLGCVSTAMGEAELEAFLEVFYQAVEHARRA